MFVSDSLHVPQAGSIDSAVIALLEKGRERREATHGEAPQGQQQTVWARMCMICIMCNYRCLMMFNDMFDDV